MLDINKLPIVNAGYVHKDGGLYMVVKLVKDYEFSNGVIDTLVEYKSITNDTIYVRRLQHFNNSFKLM